MIRYGLHERGLIPATTEICSHHAQTKSIFPKENVADMWSGISPLPSYLYSVVLKTWDNITSSCFISELTVRYFIRFYIRRKSYAGWSVSSFLLGTIELKKGLLDMCWYTKQRQMNVVSYRLRPFPYTIRVWWHYTRTFFSPRSRCQGFTFTLTN